MTLHQIDIPRRSASCQQCSQKLANEEFYFSQLEESQRQDYCKCCWEQKSKATTCFWKTRSQKALSQSSALPIQKEMRALAHLKETLGAGHTLEEQFFLALFLARKKILTFKQEIVEYGTTYQLFEIATTAETLSVQKINMLTVDAAKVQVQIAKILNEKPAD